MASTDQAIVVDCPNCRTTHWANGLCPGCSRSAAVAGEGQRDAPKEAATPKKNLDGGTARGGRKP